jgi:hypothetical protein
VPGVKAPHDMAVVASPVRLAGKERPLALLIAETAEAGSSRLHKFILLPQGKHSHQQRSLLAGPSQRIDAEWSSGDVVTCLHRKQGSHIFLVVWNTGETLSLHRCCM